MSAGYLYAMINPAMMGLVKVGKTTRTPEERLNELSAATGVPTPFVLAYQQRVSDCSQAERWVHDELARGGYRPSDSREFFTAPLNRVIDLLIAAGKLRFGGLAEAEADSAQDEAGEDSGDESDQTTLADQLYERANALRYGDDTTLRNATRALKTFLEAASLGSHAANLSAARMYEDGQGTRRDLDKALQHYRQAVDRGAWYAHAWIAGLFVQVAQWTAASRSWRDFFGEAEDRIGGDWDPLIGRVGQAVVVQLAIEKRPLVIPSDSLNLFHPQLLDGLGDHYSSMARNAPLLRHQAFLEFVECRAYLGDRLAEAMQ